MTRVALLLPLLAALVVGQDVPKPAVPPITLPSLPPMPSLPPFSLPTLAPLPGFPTIPTLPTPVAVKLPTMEEMSNFWTNGMKDSFARYSKEDMYKLHDEVMAGTAFNQFVDMGKKNMETAANIAKDSAAKIVPPPPAGATGPLGLPKVEPLDLSKLPTLPPLPTLFPMPTFPTLPPFKLPFREGEDAAAAAAKTVADAAEGVKKEGLQEVGQYYFENLTPKHALDVLTAKKQLRMPSEFAAPTIDVSKLPKVDFPKLEVPKVDLPKLELPNLVMFPSIFSAETKPVVNSSFAAKAAKQRRSKSESSYRYYRFQERFDLPDHTAAAAAAAAGHLQPAANVVATRVEPTLNLFKVQNVFNPKTL